MTDPISAAFAATTQPTPAPTLEERHEEALMLLRQAQEHIHSLRNEALHKSTVCEGHIAVIAELRSEATNLRLSLESAAHKERTLKDEVTSLRKAVIQNRLIAATACLLAGVAGTILVTSFFF